MKVLEDLQQEISELRKEVTEIKSFTKSASEIKPSINLDYAKVSESIANPLESRLNTLKTALETKSARLEGFINKIPTEINQKQTLGIDLSTKVWLAIVLLCFFLGLFLGPRGVERVEYEITKSSLREREKQIQEFRARNPGTASKYFGN